MMQKESHFGEVATESFLKATGTNIIIRGVNALRERKVAEGLMNLASGFVNFVMPTTIADMRRNGSKDSSEIGFKEASSAFVSVSLDAGSSGLVGLTLILSEAPVAEAVLLGITGKMILNSAAYGLTSGFRRDDVISSNPLSRVDTTPKPKRESKVSAIKPELLSERLNEVVESTLTDETRIVDLAYWKPGSGALLKVRTPLEWRQALLELAPKEQEFVSQSLWPLEDGGVHTLAEFRALTLEELMKIEGVAARRAEFLQQLFRKKQE